MTIRAAYDNKVPNQTTIESVVMEGKKKILKMINRPTRIKTTNFSPSRTKQSEIENTDLNKLIKRNGYNNIVTDANKIEAAYGQMTSTSLKEAQQMIIDAKEMFQEVPSEIRNRFGNDAGLFIDYATNPDNIEEMRELGLAKPEQPEQQPVQVEVINKAEEPSPPDNNAST